MKKHFAQFYAFITEQQSWFEQHLAADFEQSWDDPVWVCGSNGSGWLRGNGKNKLRFDEIGRTKGIEGRHAVAEDYARFMKALLVLVYRRRNRSISPAVAVATLMILKRWYHSLFEVTGQTHPVYRKRAARTVLTGMCYSVGSATRQGSSSLTRFIGQSAMTSRT